jgi:hypothetical protein
MGLSGNDIDRISVDVATGFGLKYPLALAYLSLNPPLSLANAVAIASIV